MSAVKNSVLCELCGKTFIGKSKIKRHVERVHANFTNEKTLRKFKSWKCAVCKSGFNSFIEFKDHLPEVHDIELTIQKLEFESDQDFKEWKNSIEEQDNISFVTHLHPNRKIPVAYYQCHRSGYFRGTLVRKRHVNHTTYKMNAYCPARIKAYICSDGSVKVEYCSTHVGHKMEYSSNFKTRRKLQTPAVDTEIIDKNNQIDNNNTEEQVVSPRKKRKSATKKDSLTDSMTLEALKKTASDQFNSMINSVTCIRQVDLILQTNANLIPRLEILKNTNPMQKPMLNYLDIIKDVSPAQTVNQQTHTSNLSESDIKYYLILKKINEPNEVATNNHPNKVATNYQPNKGPINHQPSKVARPKRLAKSNQSYKVGKNNQSYKVSSKQSPKENKINPTFKPGSRSRNKYLNKK